MAKLPPLPDPGGEADPTAAAPRPLHDALFAHNPAPMLVYERGSLALVAVNTAFERLYGYTADQALQLQLPALYRPEDQAMIIDFAAQVQGLVNAGEWTHLRADGSLLQVVAQSHDIEHQGRLCRLAVITDVTPLKRAEAALAAERDRLRLIQQALDQASEAVFWFQRDGTLDDVNESACRLLGGSRDELLALDAAQLSPDWSARALARAWPRWQADGTTVTEQRLRTRAGKVLPVQARIQVLSAGGQPRAFVLATDITQRQRTQQRDRRRLALLESLARGQEVPSLLAQLARDHEAQFADSLCSVMLMSDDRLHMVLGAAPGLPRYFTRAVDGLAIGPGVGCCGEAMATGLAVASADITTDPRWQPWAALAQRAGLRACWSEPIVGPEGRLLGVFAVYRRSPGLPDDDERAQIGFAVQLAATAITHGATTQRLRDSERRLHDVLHAIPELVWLKDRDGIFRACNAAFARLLDLPESRIIGRRDEDVAEPLTAAALRADDAAVLASGQPHTRDEWLGFARDGTRALFETIRTPLFDEHGQLQGVLGVARDITLARAGARAMHEQARLVDTMFSQTTDAIVLLDPVTHAFVNFNDVACNGLGYTREQFARLTPADLQAGLTPAQITEINAQVLSGQVVRLDTRHRRADGSLQLAELTLRTITYGGRLLLSAVWRDVTESRSNAVRVQRLNQAYAVLSGVNEAIVRLRDVDALFAEVCRITVQAGGFRLAWVGRLSDDGQTVVPVVHAGQSDGYIERVRPRMHPPMGPSTRALTSGQPVVVNDLMAEAAAGNPGAATLPRALNAVAAFPISVGGEHRICLCVCAETVGHFDDEQVALFNRLAQDIGYALAFIAAEDAQRREQQFRQQLIESVAGLFYVLDPQGRLLLWNRQLCEVSGWDDADLAGRPVAAVVAVSDHALLTELHQQVLAQGQAQAELVLRTRDGTHIPYLFAARRVEREAGQGALVVGTATDIADRVRNEAELDRYRQRLEALVAQRTAELEAVNARLHREDQRLRAMLSLSQKASTLSEPELLQWGVDEVARLTHSPLAWLRGVTPDAAGGGSPADGGALQAWASGTPEALRQPGHDLQSGLAWAAGAGLGHTLRAEGAACQGLGWPADVARLLLVPVTEDGLPRLLLCVADKAEPYTDDDERELTLVGNDLWRIVRRRRIELALEQAKQAADAANQAKSAFLANVSHEIRTPMNAIVGFAHLIKRDPLTTRQLANLDKLTDASAHLLQVINDVLDFSKIEAHKIELDCADFPLRDSIDRVVTMVADALRAKPVALSVQADGCPALLRGDRLRLEQILLNLVSNAVKFTDRGHIVLRALTQPGGPDDGAADGAPLQLRFEVEDTGIGMDAAQIPHLFEAFEQGDASTTRRFGGTGLGLAICRRLATLMGGQIGVHSQRGAGSTFWVELPFQRPARPQAEAGSRPAPAASAPWLHGDAADHQRLRGARVLVAEDNPINQEVASALLQALGLAVDLADDGEQALQLVGERSYDLVLMDVQMPVMDGLRATTALRRLPGCARLPVVAMTANAFDDDRARCLAAGMDDYLAKPVEPEALRTCLLRWLPARPAPSAPATTGDPVRDRLAALPGLQLAPALARMRGNWPLYLRTLRLFNLHHLGDLPVLRRLPDAAALADWQQTAHSVAGAAATLGAQALGDAARQLQALLPAQRQPLAPVAADPTRLQDLQAAASRLADRLADFIAQVDAVLASAESDAAPADPGAAATGTPAPVDWPAVAQRLQALQVLLASHDTLAAERVELDRPLLQAALGALAQRLEQQVQSFSFEDALATLREAQRRLPSAPAPASTPSPAAANTASTA